MFFLIRNIDVRGANAMSAYPIISGVSPLTIAGFVRNIAIKSGMDSTSNLEFSVIHHNTSIRFETVDFKKIPFQKIGALLTCSSAGKAGSTDYSSGSMSLALQPIVECNTQISVVINYGDVEITKEVIRTIIPLLRVAGGQIQSFDGVFEFESFHDAIKKGGGGYVYVERGDLLSVEPENRIQAFVDNLYPAHLPSSHEFKKQAKENKAPWIVPFNLGWFPLTEIKPNEGSRNGLNHVYAEPLIGFVEMVSARKAIQEKRQIIWKTKKIKGAYVVSTSI